MNQHTLFHSAEIDPLQAPWIQNYIPYLSFAILEEPTLNVADDEFRLVLDRHGLCLCMGGYQTPFRLDGTLYRKNALVVRAMGSPRESRILDACAGFGGDTMSLAASNHLVMVEHNIEICLLLSEYHWRLQHKVVVHNARAEQVLLEGADWDIVYLDPMFPARNKKALPKRDIQLLKRIQEYSGVEATDVSQLLEQALDNARRKVVLKRRLTDPVIRAPSSQLKGRLVRFDVYAL